MRDVGDYIYLRRVEKGMTQEELARKAGIPQPNLSQIEKGKRDLTVTTLKRIGGALGMPAGVLIDGPRKRNPGKPLKLTRQKIEALAGYIVKSEQKNVILKPKAEESQTRSFTTLRLTRPSMGHLNAFEKKLADLFVRILPSENLRPKSSRKTYQAWSELNRILSKQEIKSILERVRDEQRRFS